MLLWIIGVPKPVLASFGLQPVTDVFGQTIGYGYDANGNRTQLTLAGATNATYQYDLVNRLTQLTDAASLSFAFGYDATNKLTSRTAPNGVVSTYQYDGLDRLTRLTHAKGSTTIADFQYQFNAANNITQIIDAAGTHSYSYDSLDRLTAATHPSQANESYAYDDVGNRTASQQGSSYSYQPFDRLVAANGTSYGYDAKGNLTSKTDATGSWAYAWDYENRLKTATLAGGVAVTYSYDALGRRILRSDSNGGTSKFVYDGADVVRDLNANLTTTADYLNGPGTDNKLRQSVAGTAAYFIQDHLGTTRALTDASGSITSSLSYDSFGNVVSGSASTRYNYTERESDSDTGLMYYRARSYDRWSGRFISEDPIQFKGGINLYAYTVNNPINYTDPSGLELDSVYRAMHPLNRPASPGPVFPDNYDWWGHFWRDLFIERQDCRPPRSWGRRWVDGFYETNLAIPGLTAPSIIPGLGLGMLTSRATASVLGAPTLFEWASGGFGPISYGAAESTALETGVVATGAAVVNFAYVSIAWEAGVAVGSAINASIPRRCGCK